MQFAKKVMRTRPILASRSIRNRIFVELSFRFGFRWWELPDVKPGG